MKEPTQEMDFAATNPFTFHGIFINGSISFSHRRNLKQTAGVICNDLISCRRFDLHLLDNVIRQMANSQSQQLRLSPQNIELFSIAHLSRISLS